MSHFTSYPAYKRLEELAREPLDLSKKGELSEDRIRDFQLTVDITDADYLKLLYGTECVDEKAVEALCELAGQSGAVSHMRAIQAGEVVNSSEGRPALHTAMRLAPDEEGIPAAAAASAKLQMEQLKKLSTFLQEIEGEITDFVQIGIGGSDLGPRAIYYALERYKLEGRNAHFISNVDPDAAAAVLARLNLKTTMVVVVSKSGTTLETLTNEAIVRAAYDRMGISAEKQFVLITSEGSPLDNADSLTKYRAIFHMWDSIGGRYSVTSMIGAVTLAFAFGMPAFLDFLSGARVMDKNALEEDPRKNLSLFSALLGIWNRNFLNHQSVAVIPYSESLGRFIAHLQQLDMESNGKQCDRDGAPIDFETGPIIWGEPGTNSQHSFFQSIHQGKRVVPIEFIAFKRSQHEKDLEVQGTTSQQKLLANLFAQSLALATGENNENLNKKFFGNRPSRILLAGQLTPYTMGAILAYYENKVAFQGFIWDINSFDQEGVQYGKKLALKMLDLFKDAGDFPLGSAYLSHL